MNFNAVIDALVVSNGILAGPDCYTFFKANTNQLSDGLRPNDAGMRSYNLLWSQAMRHLYLSRGPTHQCLIGPARAPQRPGSVFS